MEGEEKMSSYQADSGSVTQRPLIFIYDTTGRDGAQARGVKFSVHDKLRLAERLDRERIPYIELGWPGANETDLEVFTMARSLDLKYSKLVAFGSTRHKGNAPGQDKTLNDLLRAETQAVAIFGKSSEFQAKAALQTDPENNLQMIFDSVKYLKERGREVIYDAEHFFEGYYGNRFYGIPGNTEYAWRTLQAARDAGADFIVLCETNGGKKPREVYEAVKEVLYRLGDVRLGIHPHRDRGLATAIALEAVEAGCVMVQGTFNGIGERTGNLDLVEAIANLHLEGYGFVGGFDVRQLKSLSRFTYDLLNLQPIDTQPFVGENSGTHKGGIHASGILRDRRTYEYVPPEIFGHRSESVVSSQSGVSTLIAIGKYNFNRDDQRLPAILKEIKRLEHLGHSFEDADGSLDLLIRRISGERTQLFDLLESRVDDFRKGDGQSSSYAVVKLRINGGEFVELEYGDGPVNALDISLKSALTKRYPELDHLQLEDYKVRVIQGPKKGTASKVRVHIVSKFGSERFGTVGVGDDILDASWQALVESYEYAHILHSNQLKTAQVLNE